MEYSGIPQKISHFLNYIFLQVIHYPKVQASVQNNKMVISIDKTVFLLEDEMIAKCSLLSFNTNIDVLAISQTGNLIICGLSDGEIHGIFIKGIPLFSQNIKQADVNLIGGRTFTGIQQVGNNFCLTCANGSVYRWVWQLNNILSYYYTCIHITIF